MTILYHPDLRRVGEQSIIGTLLTNRSETLSRLTPRFLAPGTNQARSLRDPYLSRRPIHLRRVDNSIEIAPESGVVVEVNDQLIGTDVRLPWNDLRTGITIQMARRVVLLLHLISLRNARPPHWGLIGDSESITEVRQQIAQVADLDVPVLIRGETGVGKERVAQSIHAASQRSKHQMIAVNMAAIPPSTAVSELFGHVRGAFTGAVGRHLGLFERAHGSTLFLDEIGETPVSIQTMLLRTLAEGTVRPVGDQGDRKVDVRVIAATDANLEQAGEEGTFRNALLYRLAGYEIRVPSLRERRDDIPRLTVHFLQSELDELSEAWRLRPPETAKKLWFPPPLMLRLFRHDWPGNVRQLRNTVRQLVISSRGADILRVDANVERVLSEKAARSTAIDALRADESAPSVSYYDVASNPGETTGGQSRPQEAPAPTGETAEPKPRRKELTNEEILQSLKANGWNVARTADTLGIPRPTLYNFIDRHPDLRKASDIPREELKECFHECNGDLDRMVDRLRVSKRAIKLRINALRLSHDIENE